MNIRRFKYSILPILSFAIASSFAIAEDAITLKNGDFLSGKLLNSDASGILTLSHPNSKKTIKIKESSVEKIIFDASNIKNSSLTESIQLLNGDHFPCSVTKLDEEKVTFKSDSVGNHTINRNKISYIKFNTKANRTLYKGPGDDLSAWTTTSEDWKLKDGKLSVNKRSEASKEISNLTENYILEFKTTWEETNPHLRICFSSDRKQSDKKSDFYYIDLNSHGITIYRSKKGNYDTLTQVLGNDNIYDQSHLHIAIHVDRKHQKMALYLNGKFIKNLIDPNTPPIGKHFIIKNLQRNGVLSEISDIKISSWGGKVNNELKSKKDSLTKNDLITDLSGSIMTGQIIGLSRSGDNANLNFKAPFSKKESKIPSKAIDLLEFKTPEKTPDLGTPIYHLNLASGGLVSYSDSQIINDKLVITHPILGKISVSKSKLSSVVTIPATISITNEIEEEKKETQ